MTSPADPSGAPEAALASLTPKRFRYCRIDGMEKDPAGHWVDYDDYARLEASHAALLAALKGLLDTLPLPDLTAARALTRS